LATVFRTSLKPLAPTLMLTGDSPPYLGELETRRDQMPGLVVKDRAKREKIFRREDCAGSQKRAWIAVMLTRTVAKTLSCLPNPARTILIPFLHRFLSRCHRRICGHFVSSRCPRGRSQLGIDQCPNISHTCPLQPG